MFMCCGNDSEAIVERKSIIQRDKKKKGPQARMYEDSPTESVSNSGGVFSIVNF
jgi:hypothetical protein